MNKYEDDQANYTLNEQSELSSLLMLVIASNLTEVICTVGMIIWLEVHQQSWMILFLQMHISMSCTCHLHFLVQKDPGEL